MSVIKALLTLSVLTAPFAAAGDLYIRNWCNFNVYYWRLSASGQLSNQFTMYGPGSNHWSPDFPREDVKFTVQQNGIWSGAPVFDYSYNYDQGRQWINADVVNGSPFVGHGVQVSSYGGCPRTIDWRNGVPQPGVSYVTACK
jgi:hypothetical protein